MFCSMIWATLSCMVWAEEPAYSTVMEMVGGAMGGNCSTGKNL